MQAKWFRRYIHGFAWHKNNKVMRKNLYVDIWTRLVPYITQALQQSMLEESAMAMQLNPDAFNAAGNRKSYSFSLTFVNGYSRINEGSAVSRDLRMTLLGNVKFKEFSANKTITLRLDNTFRFIMSCTLS